MSVKFDPQMLSFVRSLVRPKIFEAIELAEKGALTYSSVASEKKFINEIVLLEYAGFIKPSLDDGKIKIFVLTEKGERLKQLLINLTALVYGDSYE